MSVAVMVSMLLVGFAPLQRGVGVGSPSSMRRRRAARPRVRHVLPERGIRHGPDPDYFYVGQKFATGAYDTWRDFLSFDTSSIPDDTVIGGATLSLYLANDYSTADFTVDVYSFRLHVPSTGPPGPAGRAAGSYFNTSGVSAGAWYSVNVSVDSISLTGGLQVLRRQRQGASSVTPSHQRVHPVQRLHQRERPEARPARGGHHELGVGPGRHDEHDRPRTSGTRAPRPGRAGDRDVLALD